MKHTRSKIQSSFMTSLIVCSLLFSSCLAQLSEFELDAEAGNNGSFELVKNNLPINWLVYTQNTTNQGKFNYSFDTTMPKEGKQSLKFSVESCSDKGGRYSPGIAQEMEVEAGKEYHIKLWLKNSGSHILINITAVDAKHMTQGPKTMISDTITEWKEYSFNYKIPVNMKRLRLEVNILKPGSVWIDGIQLEKHSATH